MYYTDGKSVGDRPGVLIRDKNFSIGQEIREKLYRGEKVFLVARTRPNTKQNK